MGKVITYMQYKRDVPGGDASPTLKSVSVETNQERQVKFSSLLLQMGEFPSMSVMADL